MHFPADMRPGPGLDRGAAGDRQMRPECRTLGSPLILLSTTAVGSLFAVNEGQKEIAQTRDSFSRRGCDCR